MSSMKDAAVSDKAQRIIAKNVSVVILDETHSHSTVNTQDPYNKHFYLKL